MIGQTGEVSWALRFSVFTSAESLVRAPQITDVLEIYRLYWKLRKTLIENYDKFEKEYLKIYVIAKNFISALQESRRWSVWKQYRLQNTNLWQIKLIESDVFQMEFSSNDSKILLERLVELSTSQN